MNCDKYYELILNIDGKSQFIVVDDYFPDDRKN